MHFSAIFIFFHTLVGLANLVSRAFPLKKWTRLWSRNISMDINHPESSPLVRPYGIPRLIIGFTQLSLAKGITQPNRYYMTVCILVYMDRFMFLLRQTCLPGYFQLYFTSQLFFCYGSNSIKKYQRNTWPFGMH